MENSSFTVENVETQLNTQVEGQENHSEENYRQEIEDIVRGFIIEKDILAQTHEEEINRMKRRFDLERKQLLKQLEMDKEQMIEASRITDTVANTEVSFAVSDTFASDAGRLHSFSESSADVQRSSSFQRRSNGDHDIDEVDSNLIREIAEVYLRINNGTLTGQMRPELDLEDKYEREREVLERSFQLEKRELKRKLEEDCHHRLEQERIKYEGNMAEMKTTISELQWQKREAENRLRHEKEKWEMNVERDKNDTEKRHLQLLHDTRRKLEEKHSNELEKQRERYEENISDLQTDISKLTLQLKELNENLNQEKEIIMTKFEREIKEMEQAFLEQRNSLKANFEAEFMMRIENETSLLKTVNIKLKEDLEIMEKEKKDVERRGKEERRKLEERFEEEISEMERRQSEEKRALKLKLEERYQLGLAREKGGLEETIQELSEEMTLLKQENSQMEITFAERREELLRQLDMETEDMRRKIIGEREEIRIRVENELAQKFMIEKTTKDDAFRHHERDALILKGKCDDLELKMSVLTQEREMLIRERAKLEENLRSKETRLKEMNDGRISSGAGQDLSAKLKETIREKDNELATVKFENQQHELSLSAMRREKSDLEDEIASLKRRLSNSTGQFGMKFGSNDSELASMQENVRRKDGEVSTLQREKHDLESRLSSIQRKNDELEDELATLRRKKLEVEDEISALKRDKSDSDNQVASLKRDKAELEELIANLKRKQSDLEDSMAVMKRGKVELEHEIAILKRHNSTMEIEVHRQFNDQHEKSRNVYNEHEDVSHDNVTSRVTHENIAPSATREVYYQSQDSSVFNEGVRGSDHKRDAKEWQRMVSDLTRQRNDLESAIRRLSEEKSDLEKDLSVQLEYRRKVLSQEKEGVLQDKQNDEDRWVLQRKKDDLERRIASLKEEQADLESEVSQYHREVTSLEARLSELNDESASLEQEIKALKYEKLSVVKTIENVTNEKREVGGNRKLQSGIPLRKVDKPQFDNSMAKQIADLQQERDTLNKQLVDLQTENSTKNVHFSKEYTQNDEKEISELKTIRKELERAITILRRNKTEVEAEITIVQETARQEESDLDKLRKERLDLELQITALQSQNTRLEAEGSVMKDERHRDENEVDRLRREKADLEKDVFGLQSQQRILQTDTSMGDEAWRKKTSATIGLEKNVQDIIKQLETLTSQKEVLQSETMTVQMLKDRVETEVQELRQEKTEIEIQLSRLKMEYQEQSQGHILDTAAGEVDWRFETNETLRVQEELDELQRQKQDLQSEVLRIQTLKNNEEDELQKLRQKKSEMEIYIYDLQTKIGRLEMNGQPTEQEPHELRNATDGTSLTDDHGKSEVSRLSSDLNRRGEIETLQDYRSSQSLLQTSHSFSRSYNVTSYNSETSISNSHVHTHSPQQSVSSETLATNPLRSSSFYDDCLKADNNLMSLKRERDEIESQICDMKNQLTILQTEVTGLENRKTILETTHLNYATDNLRAGSVNGHGVSVDTDLDYNITRAITGVTIQFYYPC